MTMKRKKTRIAPRHTRHRTLTTTAGQDLEPLIGFMKAAISELQVVRRCLGSHDLALWFTRRILPHGHLLEDGLFRLFRHDPVRPRREGGLHQRLLRSGPAAKSNAADRGHYGGRPGVLSQCGGFRLARAEAPCGGIRPLSASNAEVEQWRREEVVQAGCSYDR
jgi:hypothetical protein